MKKKLKNLCKSEQYISIYSRSEGNQNTFSYGQILAVSEIYYALVMFSPSGKFDGIKVGEIDNILKIETGVLYNQRMQKIIDKKSYKKEDYNIKEENIVLSFLECAQKKEYIVSIELANSGINDVVGFVDCLENSVCSVNQVDLYGYNDGRVFFEIDDISQIICNSLEEQTLLNLWKHNTSDDPMCY